MLSARRPQHGRRPRQVTPVRRTAQPSAEVSRAGLTTRAAILGLVVCALVVSAALPLREYISQRGQIASVRTQQNHQKSRVQALKDQLQQLQDPAYIKAQARARLHFVLPGETAYVVLTPSAGPMAAGKTALTATTATGAAAPWYSQVWGSVKVADRAVSPSAAP